jgi:type II secretory pathway pseudopilin PulG
LVVITIMAIVAGVVLTKFDSVSHDQLLGAAQIVAADAAHARNLAVTNNSSYKITFDRAANRYVITHSGTNGALDVLPTSAFHSASGSTTQHATDLSSLPLGSSLVSLAVVEASNPLSAGTPVEVLDVEFGPLGETTRTLRTTVWLSAGTSRERKFIGIEIDPVTGLASIGEVQTSVPETIAFEDAADPASVPEYSEPESTEPVADDPASMPTEPESTEPVADDPYSIPTEPPSTP